MNGNGTRSPDAIIADIQQIRSEMDSTLLAIEERLTPGQMVDQGLDTVKKYRIKVRPLTRGDFESAAKLIHPQTTKEEMQKYYNWKESAEEG